MTSACGGGGIYERKDTVPPGLAGPAGEDLVAGRAFVTATIKVEPVAAGKPIVRRHVVVWNDVHQGQSVQGLFPLRR